MESGRDGYLKSMSSSTISPSKLSTFLPKLFEILGLYSTNSKTLSAAQSLSSTQCKIAQSKNGTTSINSIHHET